MDNVQLTMDNVGYRLIELTSEPNCPLFIVNC